MKKCFLSLIEIFNLLVIFTLDNAKHMLYECTFTPYYRVSLHHIFKDIKCVFLQLLIILIIILSGFLVIQFTASKYQQKTTEWCSYTLSICSQKFSAFLWPRPFCLGFPPLVLSPPPPHLGANPLTDLSYQTAARILAASSVDALYVMRDLSQNFPTEAM